MDARLHILTTTACRPAVEAHRSIPGFDASGAGVVAHYLDGRELDPATREVVDAWQDLRTRTAQCTRYNSPARFLNAVAAALPGQEQPVAVLILRDGRAEAVVCGFYEARALWRNSGRLGLLLPRLRCLTVLQTGLITDCTPAAVALVSRYLRELVAQGIVHRLELENVPVSEPLHGALTGPDGLPGRTVSLDKVRWRRRLTDPLTGEPIAYHSAKTRSGMRRKLRQLAKEFGGDLELVKVTSPEQTDDFVSKAAGIVKQTYQAGLGSGASDTPECKAFAREMAAEGALRGYMFLGGGEAISYVMGDLEAGCFHLWATSFLPEYGKYSPGIVLLNQVMEDLIESGAEIFDFGDGEAEYKQLLGSERREEQDLRVYSTGLRSRTAYTFDVGVARLRLAARRRLAAMGLLHRARKTRRGLLRRTAAG